MLISFMRDVQDLRVQTVYSFHPAGKHINMAITNDSHQLKNSQPYSTKYQNI